MWVAHIGAVFNNRRPTSFIYLTVIFCLVVIFIIFFLLLARQESSSVLLSAIQTLILSII